MPVHALIIPGPQTAAYCVAIDIAQVDRLPAYTSMCIFDDQWAAV